MQDIDDLNPPSEQRAPPRRNRRSRVLHAVRRFLKNDQLIMVGLALIVGGGVGLLAIGLRLMIAAVQNGSFGTNADFLVAHVETLPGWLVVAIPTLGGLAVGVFTYHFLPGRRAQGMADAIEASTLHPDKMGLRTGLAAAFASAVSIGSGASVGREGPAVHLGATFAAWVSRKLRLTRRLSRTLLGCGAAAAVAASFNAPIAGALFATEVIVGHYAVSAFAPIVVASVTGTVVARSFFGDHPAFAIPVGSHGLWEFPAFALLGLLSGLVAVAMVRGIFLVSKTMARLPSPTWLNPALAGFLVGTMALAYPHVLGVGYEATSLALHGQLALSLLLGLIVAKLAATAISLGGGFSGGVFSPAVVIGALFGAAFGAAIELLIPGFTEQSSDYAVVGMGAVASAVLGAPVSTTLITFELTNDYSLAMAVMLGAVLASVVMRSMVGPSFFDAQLRARGVDLGLEAERAALAEISVAKIMSARGELVRQDMTLPGLRQALQASEIGMVFVVRDNGMFWGTLTLSDLDEVAFAVGMDDLIVAGDVVRPHPPFLLPTDPLSRALDHMNQHNCDVMAVVDHGDRQIFMGCLRKVDVLDAHRRVLAGLRHEERGGV